jgi:hypothetical protein
MQGTIWRCQVVQRGAAFRLDALKFSSGILNSYEAVPIAPQPCASSRKTGEIGSQNQSSRRKRFSERLHGREIYQKDNRTHEPNNTARALEVRTKPTL